MRLPPDERRHLELLEFLASGGPELRSTEAFYGAD
jgi:hypothetical protein